MRHDARRRLRGHPAQVGVRNHGVLQLLVRGVLRLRHHSEELRPVWQRANLEHGLSELPRPLHHRAVRRLRVQGVQHGFKCILDHLLQDVPPRRLPQDLRIGLEHRPDDPRPHFRRDRPYAIPGAASDSPVPPSSPEHPLAALPSSRSERDAARGHVQLCAPVHQPRVVLRRTRPRHGDDGELAPVPQRQSPRRAALVGDELHQHRRVDVRSRVPVYQLCTEGRLGKRCGVGVVRSGRVSQRIQRHGGDRSVRDVAAGRVAAVPVLAAGLVVPDPHRHGPKRPVLGVLGTPARHRQRQGRLRWT